MKPRAIGALVGRVVLSGVFAVAAVTKLADPAAFAGDIERYRLIGAIPAAVLAVYVPWLELTLAVALWVRAVRAMAGAVLVALLAGFSIAVGLAWARGLDLECGCFGAAAAMPVRWAFLRNVVLLAMAAWVWRVDTARAKN